MLTHTELETYYQQRRLSPIARQIVDTVRRSPPTRRVKSGLINVPVRFASRKMGLTIQGESHRNELPAIIGWEHDATTYEFYDQPPKIKLNYQDANGRRLGYLRTPDFFVLQRDFTGWVECKTEEWLRKEASQGSRLYIADGPGRWRCPPAEEYAASLGLGFRVRSSIETNWTAVRNAEFLSDYLGDGVPSPTARQLALATELLKDQAWMRLKELLGAHAQLSADAIYTMIATGHLYVDLATDLLAEPERALVFRDSLAAQAYRASLKSSSLPVAPDLLAIKLEPNQKFNWDGRLITILNVGDTEIVLQDEERNLSILSRDDIARLVRAGSIQGLPKDIELRWAQVEQALRHTSPDGFQLALARYNSIRPDRQAGDPPAIGRPRVHRKWRAAFRKAAEATGFGFLGLLPNIHLRGNRRRKLDDRVIAIMDAVIDELYAKTGSRGLVACWGEARNRCLAEGLVPPSEVAFRNQIKLRRRHDLQLAREGEKAAYRDEAFQWHLEQTSPRHGERPFEIVHIDHTELDLQFVGSRFGEPLAKAWLTVMIDAFSRRILAWVIQFEPPSYRACMAVIRECLRNHSRAPRYVVVDNGTEFDSEYFELLLAGLGCHKKSRPGGKPRFGSPVERIFGITNDAFVHNLAGNNQALQKPRQMSAGHDPRELAVWTLPLFAEAFQGFLDRVYHAAEHPALGMSPTAMEEIGLAQTGPRTHTLIPYTPALAVMCLPSTGKGEVKVDPARGIKIHSIFYWAEEFRAPAWQGKSVPVRYDPHDMSLAFAWLKDQWVPCRSEYAPVFHGRSEREIALATQEVRARIKRTGTRRAVTASLIASYLQGTDVTEKSLLEEKKHRESVAAGDHDLQALLSLPNAGTQSLSATSIWDNLEHRYFGEFK